MAAKTKCLVCDEAVWGFELTKHLFYTHLVYKKWTEACEKYGHRCWCGALFQDFGWWVQHLRENRGWKAHYAACALGLKIDSRCSESNT